MNTLKKIDWNKNYLKEALEQEPTPVHKGFSKSIGDKTNEMRIFLTKLKNRNHDRG